MRRRRCAVLVPGPMPAQPGSVGRSPRAGLVSLHPGGSGHRAGRHYDRSARCLLDWDWANSPRPRKPGPELRRKGPHGRPPRAARGAPRGERADRKVRAALRTRGRLVRLAALHPPRRMSPGEREGKHNSGAKTRRENDGGCPESEFHSPRHARPLAGVPLCGARDAQARGQAQCSTRRRHAHDAALGVRAVAVLARLRGRPMPQGARLPRRPGRLLRPALAAAAGGSPGVVSRRDHGKVGRREPASRRRRRLRGGAGLPRANRAGVAVARRAGRAFAGAGRAIAGRARDREQCAASADAVMRDARAARSSLSPRAGRGLG